jgi:hypothetical protein
LPCVELKIPDPYKTIRKTTEQKYLLIAELSKVYEVGRGGDRKTEDFKKDKLSSMKEDVLEKTAKATGVNEKTVQRAREYSRLVKESPELKKGEKDKLSSTPQ